MKRAKEHRTGYVVWLFGEHFWHRTLRGARRRSLAATNYCNGREQNQVIRVSDGENMHGCSEEADL